MHLAENAQENASEVCSGGHEGSIGAQQNAPTFDCRFYTVALIHPTCQYERFRNRALSGLSEGPDSLIKRPNFKIIYNFLIKNKG